MLRGQIRHADYREVWKMPKTRHTMKGCTKPARPQRIFLRGRITKNLPREETEGQSEHLRPKMQRPPQGLHHFQRQEPVLSSDSYVPLGGGVSNGHLASSTAIHTLTSIQTVPTAEVNNYSWPLSNIDPSRPCGRKNHRNNGQRSALRASHGQKRSSSGSDSGSGSGSCWIGSRR